MRRAMLTATSAAPVPSFVAVGAIDSGAGAIAKPAGVQNGDTVYVLLADDDGVPTAGPSGFTLVNGANIADEDHVYFAVYRRTIDGSEGSTFAATGDVGVAVAYRNLGATASDSDNSAALTTTVTYNALSNASGDAVIGFGLGYGASAIATPAGHAERLDSAFGIFRFQVVDILTAGANVAAATATATGAGLTIAVRAAYPPA